MLAERVLHVVGQVLFPMTLLSIVCARLSRLEGDGGSEWSAFFDGLSLFLTIILLGSCISIIVINIIKKYLRHNL